MKVLTFDDGDFITDADFWFGEPPVSRGRSNAPNRSGRASSRPWEERTSQRVALGSGHRRKLKATKSNR